MDFIQTHLRKKICIICGRNLSVSKIVVILLLLIQILNIFSRFIWEANTNMIRKHNLEVDLGLHSYTLGMNKYSDLVGFDHFSIELLY